MKTTLIAFLLILAGVLWRVALVFEPGLFNVAPVTALAFCGAVYFRDWRWWLAPFAMLALSDLWLTHYHATEFGYQWSIQESLLRALCIAAAIGVGRLVARRRNLLTLAAGALGSSLIFYIGTNGVAWFLDPYYVKSLAGWWQAMTIGHPEFPPTLWFFRNTLAGDILFTGIFVVCTELALARDRAASPASADLR